MTGLKETKKAARLNIPSRGAYGTKIRPRFRPVTMDGETARTFATQTPPARDPEEVHLSPTTFNLFAVHKANSGDGPELPQAALVIGEVRLALRKRCVRSLSVSQQAPLFRRISQRLASTKESLPAVVEEAVRWTLMHYDC